MSKTKASMGAFLSFLGFDPSMFGFDPPIDEEKLEKLKADCARKFSCENNFDNKCFRKNALRLHPDRNKDKDQKTMDTLYKNLGNCKDLVNAETNAEKREHMKQVKKDFNQAEAKTKDEKRENSLQIQGGGLARAKHNLMVAEMRAGARNVEARRQYNAMVREYIQSHRG